MHHKFVRYPMGAAAAILLINVTLADEPRAPVTLAVVGSPMPDIVIGDIRHCPLKIAPVAKPSGDRVEFSLPAGNPVGITLTSRRGGDICGGSLYMVPEISAGYAARLTPGALCAAQLFRIDPQAQPPVRLLQTDNHPELNDFICATQQGPPGTSRLSVGHNVGRSTVRVDIGHGGECGTFEHVSATDTGIELQSGAPQWLRVKFRATAGTADGGALLNYCDVSVTFTPIAGTAYMIDAGDDLKHCDVRLLKADAAGSLSLAPVDRAKDANDCKSSK